MIIHNTIYREASVATGSPLVLINAFPVDHRMWDRCAEVVVEMSGGRDGGRYAVWAPDMPGSGSSPVPDRESTGPVAGDGSYPRALDALTDSYASLVEDSGYSGAIWVGLSMGGYVAANMQRRHPELVKGIALCDTRVAVDEPRAKAGRLRCADEAERRGDVAPVMHFAEPQEGDSSVKMSSAFVETFAGWIRDQSPEGIAWRQRMAAGRPDLTDQLATIRVPAAVVVGDRDPSSSIPSMKDIANGMTSTACSFTVVEDCGHFSAVEHPRALARQLVNLVDRVNRA
ncbi:alpha/beta hydrolase [uncultured Bifidobacterium sp.]|uniref:alpha/beta fold hydrolase n=1 Tax=uncultured Bifidobacterium sp. TaxID=165187 RepID=UPI00261E8931|nr:alpha/beta hydrolase [uncultured Bifidobacterium sp.]